MEERRSTRWLRLVSISGVLVLTLAAWQFFAQPQSAHAATVPNTIFLDTTTGSIPVTTASSSGTLSYTVTNLSGKQVGSGGPLAVSNGQVTVTLPQEPDGYYVLNVTDNTTSPATLQHISYSVVAPFNLPTDSPFGMGTHLPPTPDTTGTALLLTTLGTAWIRTDINWADVEITAGQYTFTKFDPYMQELTQYNIHPLVILDYANPLYDNGNTPYDTTGYTAFANYVKAVLNHYGSQIQAVEVWNEPNGGWFDSGPCKQSPSCYKQLLQTTYQAVKSIRPDVTVVGGATFGVDLNWLQQVFQDGGMPYLDAVSNHPYLGNQQPEAGPTDQQEAGLENLIKQYNNGQPKPIWVTEQGWACCSAITGEEQAAYLVRSTTMALAAGVQKFFVYDLLDGPDAYGVMNAPDAAGRYTPKPAYAAYAALTRQLSGATFSQAQNSSNVYDEVFSKNGTNNLRVLWSPQVARHFTLATSSALTVVNMLGQSQTVQPTNGQVTLTLTGDPIYVYGTATPVAISDFATDFESGSPQPTWTSTPDSGAYPAGGIANVGGVCCGLTGPEALVGNGAPLTDHSGSQAQLYSGSSTSSGSHAYAYMKVFDLSNSPITVGSTTTLSYWIDPESAGNSYNYASGNNSTCVAVDLIFSDGSNLRDSGLMDQHGNRVHPAYQCNHLTLDTWNQVVVSLGAWGNGKKITRIDVGYDQVNSGGGYRGYLEDISIYDGGIPGFATDFESGSPQPTWTSTGDSGVYPAGGIANVGGVCCGLSGPEVEVGNGAPLTNHSGSHALLYSGSSTSPGSEAYAYMKVFDLSSNPLIVTSTTTLSYWIEPESAASSYNYASGSNSTCVAVDLIFSDGTNLRDSGLVDQNGNRIHPADQCNHLMLDTWNLVTVNLGSWGNGKTIVRIDVGYDQVNSGGGYRGYLDDISISG